MEGSKGMGYPYQAGTYGKGHVTVIGLTQPHPKKLAIVVVDEGFTSKGPPLHGKGGL